MKTNLIQSLFLITLVTTLASCVPLQSASSAVDSTQTNIPLESTFTPTSIFYSTPSFATETLTPVPANCVIIGCPLNLMPTKSSVNKTPVPIIRETKFVKFDFSKAKKVFRVAISPDGKKLAVSSENGIWFYNIKTGAFIWKIDYPNDISTTKVFTFFPISWSPDSNILASGLRNGQINLWDVNSRKQITQLTLKNAYATNLSWSHDGKLLASTSMVENVFDHGDLNIWNVHTEQSLWTFPIKSSLAWNIDFSPNSLFVAVVTVNFPPYGLRIWDLISGKETFLSGYSNLIDRKDGFQPVSWHPNSVSPHLAYGGCAGIYSAKWSPDGKSLLTVDECFGILTVWDAESGQKRYSLEGAEWMSIWSPDGKYFAFDEWRPNNIQVHLSQSGESYVNLSCPAKVPQFLGATAGDMIWAANDNKLFAVNLDGELCSWVIP